MKYDRLFESIHDASPAPQLEAALNDDAVEAGIVSKASPNTLVGSRLFNVGTAAMDLLRTAPDQPVIESPITIPEGQDELGRFTLRILNGSLIRRPPKAGTPQLISPKMDKIGTDVHTAQHFVDAFEAIGREYALLDDDQGELELDEDEYEDEAEPSLLLADQDGRPAVLKIYPKQIGITLRPIAINRVMYPLGVAVAVEEAEGLPWEEVGDLYVARMESRAVQAIAPLTYTALTFKREDRRPALRPVSGGQVPRELVRIMDRNTIPKLLALLPDQKTLARVYADLA